MLFEPVAMFFRSLLGLIVCLRTRMLIEYVFALALENLVDDPLQVVVRDWIWGRLT